MAKKVLTKGKSDLPVSRSGVESDEASPRSLNRKRTATPTDGLPSALQGHSDTGGTKILPPRACMCGCNTMFTPLRPNHRFIEDHRFSTYETHSCPLCQGMHRVKVHHGSVGSDPRDSSLIDEAIEEQRNG